MGAIEPTSQTNRIRCSIPLRDADLALGNANWTKALQAASDWVWSANLNPEAFPNNLGRFFLQIPGVFEQQLNYSTTLIFDQPSFRNGIQVSGFIDRVTRELVISYIAQRRRSWYSMTHHAILGRLTAIQAGMSEQEYSDKWSSLLEFADKPGVYSPLQRQALQFASAFATNPKSYSDEQFEELKAALAGSIEARYAKEAQWLDRADRARRARAMGLANGENGDELDERIRVATQATSAKPSARLIEQHVNAAVVELAFLCLQFTALTAVFTGLNVPDEDFLPGVMKGLLPDPVIKRVNELCELGGSGLGGLVPPAVQIDLDAIKTGRVTVAPAALTRCRIPMTNYEVAYQDRDRGVTVGGVQVGVYGWGFGAHFPGSLVYALMHHPELARFEPPYSLPLLFNEDEWRNGVQTGGFVSRLLKEIVIQKVYRTNRSRYGLEHHTMFLFNAVADEFGAGRWPVHDEHEQAAVKAKAAARATDICLHLDDPGNAPARTYSALEIAVLEWVEALMRAPHSAHSVEGELREQLDAVNRREVSRGDRVLDLSGNVGDEFAFARLIDHQISELAMLVGHMDGLGRALTMLQLPAEQAVSASSGFFQDRPALHDVLKFVGVSDSVMTVNELTVNPALAAQLSGTGKKTAVTADVAARTGEY